MAESKIGQYAFLVGVIIALLAGIASAALAAYAGIIGLVLVILGLAVGFLNVKDKETTNFLVAAIALMMTSAIAGWVYIDIAGLGGIIAKVLGNIGVFVAPAAVIVSLKAVWALARD